jgi:drug/metabolite transporter (DMT)-like permease
VPYLGELSALLTAILWSGSALIFARASTRINPLQVNVIRLCFAVLYLLAVIALFHLEVNLTTAQLSNLCISGVIGLALGDTFLFKAFKELGARLSMLIMSLAPAIAAILAAVMINDTLTSLGVFGMCVTVAGVAIVVLRESPSGPAVVRWDALGLFFAFLGAVGQGVGLVFAKMAFNEHDINGFVATGIRIAASLVILIPGSFVSGRLDNPVTLVQKERRAFLLVAVGAVLGPFLGIACSLIAIAHTSVGAAASIMGTVPVVMLPMVRLIYKERLTKSAVAGALLAVIGVVILFLR